MQTIEDFLLGYFHDFASRDAAMAARVASELTPT